MSVPVNKRAKSKFEVLIKARELVKYTLEIIKNDKIFIPEYECFTSWKAHTSKGNSFKLINRMNAYLKSLWRG